MLLIATTRQLVICQHQGGTTHIEFAHVEGASHHQGHHHGGCGHDHVHLAPAVPDSDPDHDDHDDDCDDPHSSCDHVHLSVDVGPKPMSDVVDVPMPDAAAMALPPQRLRWSGAVRPAAEPPPATGPPRPRPRPYLALRASTVLLI